MANTTSARKAARKIVRRTKVNQARLSRTRSYVSKLEEAIAGGDKKAALAALKVAESIVMRSAQKGIIPKTTASRTVSRLTRRVAKLGK